MSSSTLLILCYACAAASGLVIYSPELPPAISSGSSLVPPVAVELGSRALARPPAISSAVSSSVLPPVAVELGSRAGYERHPAFAALSRPSVEYPAQTPRDPLRIVRLWARAVGLLGLLALVSGARLVELSRTSRSAARAFAGMAPRLNSPVLNRTVRSAARAFSGMEPQLCWFP